MKKYDPYALLIKQIRKGRCNNTVEKIIWAK
jgi:hypothetical protein